MIELYLPRSVQSSVFMAAFKRSVVPLANGIRIHFGIAHLYSITYCSRANNSNSDNLPKVFEYLHQQINAAN